MVATINLPYDLSWNTIDLVFPVGQLDKLQKQECRTVGPLLVTPWRITKV